MYRFDSLLLYKKFPHRAFFSPSLRVNERISSDVQLGTFHSYYMYMHIIISSTRDD